MLTGLTIIVSTQEYDVQDSDIAQLSDEAVAYKTDFLPCHDDLPEIQYVMTQLHNIMEAYKEDKQIDEQPVYVGMWFSDKPEYEVSFTPELRVVK